jgi:hypothetical protein
LGAGFGTIRGTWWRTSIEAERLSKQSRISIGRNGSGIEKLPAAMEDNGLTNFPSTATLSVYVGHDGLMDFAIEDRFRGAGKTQREVIVLACANKQFFAEGLKSTDAAARAMDYRFDGAGSVLTLVCEELHNRSDKDRSRRTRST